jgi:predicted Kef-type K+ transport protein
MTDRREGLRQFIRHPVMGLILLACIAGGIFVGFWIEPIVGWLCVGVLAAGLAVRLVRWMAARREKD